MFSDGGSGWLVCGVEVFGTWLVSLNRFEISSVMFFLDMLSSSSSSSLFPVTLVSRCTGGVATCAMFACRTPAV